MVVALSRKDNEWNDRGEGRGRLKVGPRPEEVL